MGLRDLIKKKDQLAQDTPGREAAIRSLSGPEFTMIRSDTLTQEIVQPPDYNDGRGAGSGFLTAKEPSRARRSLDVFRPSSRSRSASASSQNRQHLETHDGEAVRGRRLSQRLHLSRQPEASDSVPQNLPEIVVPTEGQPEDREHAEGQWEARATLLAGHNELARSRPSSPGPSRDRSPSVGRRAPMTSQAIDEKIQEAIRLHEEGDLERSTSLFGSLADPNGANNPLSQVLYGLALRHGWGCPPDPARAVHYLSAAASNAASVEQMALQAGLSKGGAAKGELVLAIFELANCFRHGWGIPEDAVAAKQYYETAANLGDTDAMNEIGWCYLEGYGCKKDKHASARYYRLAEKAGHKTLGNTWIWKDKYNPPGESPKKK